MKRNSIVIVIVLLAVTIAMGTLIRSGESEALLELVDCSWYVKDDTVVFEGILKNNSDKPVAYVKVEVVYYDGENGNILASDYGYPVQEYPLQPDHFGSFGKVTFNAPVSEIKWAEYRIVDYQQVF
ncbi:MAG: FxLYD domain-containing protein [Desulfotomaculaceae bacterium]|nr:FxLYD domain-containing protein [Desulfotomaculaceae bacterium]